jgi:DNA adenine methylase
MTQLSPTFIKWAGGKTQLISQLSAFMPSKFNNYLEPFLGSGAVFFFVEKQHGSKAILSDSNEELINAFKVVKEHPNELLPLLSEHKKNHSKEYYYKIRGQETSGLNDAELAARFIYLNKTCFNGLYRVNSKGKFNVPIGSYKNPEIYSENTLLSASRLLKKATLKVMPFEDVTAYAHDGDFVYFDPPYYPISKTSFTSYTKDSFGETEHKRLSKVYSTLNKKGCLLMLSNSDADFIKGLYAGFNQITVKARRSINCIATGRGKINELLVTNYEVASSV